MVRGLVINRFDGPGVQIDGNSNIVEGNFIGTDASGTNALGNGGGVFVDGDSNAIGSNLPSQRNLVSGNDDDGVTLEVSARMPTRCSVRGNLNSAPNKVFEIHVYCQPLWQRGQEVQRRHERGHRR